MKTITLNPAEFSALNRLVDSVSIGQIDLAEIRRHPEDFSLVDCLARAQKICESIPVGFEPTEITSALTAV